MRSSAWACPSWTMMRLKDLASQFDRNAEELYVAPRLR